MASFSNAGSVFDARWWFRQGTWSTESFTTNAWVVRTGSGQTITFTSATGFAALQFPSQVPVGIVSGLTLRDSTGVLATADNVAALNLNPETIITDPDRLVAGADTFGGSAGFDVLNGGSGDDSVAAGDGRDTIGDSAGADTVSGGAGADSITDFTGANLLQGDDGDDQIAGYGAIFGGAGADSISGGLGPLNGDAGNDTIAVFNPTGVGTVAGGEGDDLVMVSGSTEPLTIDGGAGFDTAVVFYEGGPLGAGLLGSVRLTGVERTVIYAAHDVDASGLGVGVEVVNGFGTGFPLGFGSASDNRFTGSAFADTLSGGEGADTISGGAGDDSMNGGDQGWGRNPSSQPGSPPQPMVYDLADYSAAPGGVVVDLNVQVAQDTGWGRDTLKGFEGLLGSAFDDVLVGAGGDAGFSTDPTPPRLGARLDGAAGADLLVGSAYGDTLAGGVGADTLQGGQGNDLLRGGTGVDQLTGGADTDTFELSVTDGTPDRITDFNAGGVPDLIRLVDAAGQPVGGQGGLLVWNQVSGQLLWDADGDAGPGAGLVVATIQGSGALQSASLAAGFMPALLRTITAAGTSDVAPTYPGVRLEGSNAVDHLAGTPGEDTLSGGGGDDWLDGQGGNDVLTGGDGRDLFIFATDGSIDRTTDFDANGGDVIALFDSQGRLLSGVGGILILDQATRALSWDPDSDAGPAAPVRIGTLEGTVHPLTRASFAAGFTPNGVRTLDPFGGRQDLVFDRSGQAFDTGLATYTADGRLRTYDVHFDDGSTSLTTNDLENTQEWSRVIVDRDPFGAVKAFSVFHDDGAQTLWQYDTNNSRPWTRVLEEYDALGRLSQQSGAYDDGTAFERHVDTYDTQPWAYSYDTFGPNGLVSHTLYNADGSVFH